MYSLYNSLFIISKGLCQVLFCFVFKLLFLSITSLHATMCSHSGTIRILIAGKSASSAFSINHRILLWHEFLFICLKDSFLTEENEVLVKILELKKELKAYRKCI